MTRPHPRPAPSEVLLHLGPCRDLPARFGARLAAAGGHAQPGSGTAGPLVRLPFAGNGELIDDLVRAYPGPVATLVAVTRAEAPGFPSADVTQALADLLPALRHPRRGAGSAAGAVRERFAEAVAGFDWRRWLDRPAGRSVPAGAADRPVPAPLAAGLAAHRAARPAAEDDPAPARRGP